MLINLSQKMLATRSYLPRDVEAMVSGLQNYTYINENVQTLLQNSAVTTSIVKWLNQY